VPLALTTPLRDVPGIIPRDADALANMGLPNVGRLIAHLPMRYEHEEAEAGIADLEPGRVVSARGEITATRVSGVGRKRRFEAVLCDESGRLDLVWFNMGFLRDKIGPGSRLRVQGTAKQRGPGLQLANPRFEILDPEGGRARDGGRAPPPGLPRDRDDQQPGDRACVRAVLDDALALIDDHLDDDYRRERELPTLRDAYRMLHAPESEGDHRSGRRRLAYDELLLLQLGVHMKRAHLRRTLTAPPLRHDEAIDARIRARLPFTLTPQQDRVVEDIARDLALSTPTNRLIQGDVGSGKTAWRSTRCSWRPRPTTRRRCSRRRSCSPSSTSLSIGARCSRARRCARAAHGLDARARAGGPARADRGGRGRHRDRHARAADRDGPVPALAVAIIDEQHRFGVHQRAHLRSHATVEGETRRSRPTCW
jgi:ATP-dependent DNA helicase RecG